MLIKKNALENFLRYVKVDTQSENNSDSFPSTKKQFDLALILVEQLKSFGLQDAHVDENCYVLATLPKTCSSDTPVIGLIAHLDTSPDVSGTNIVPKVIEEYKGGDIVVNNELGIIIKVSENKYLPECIGHTIVTTDGTTLLGADDKAGIAAIMTAIEYLLRHPEIKHGTIKIAFTPDEEIGMGAERFDIKKFGADFAYTVDGGFTGELNKETFSADAAVVQVIGRDIHPGKAKDIMVNSIRVLADIIAELPPEMSPEKTGGYDPFIHPVSMNGSVLASSLKLILRDFRTEGLDQQKQILEQIVSKVRLKHPGSIISLSITETYRNMRDTLEKFPHVTDRLFRAAEKAGTKPYWEPIRGGTDGSRLTSMGLPTPNIFTGGNNAHSRTEWLSVDSLAKAIETVVEVVKTE